MSQLRTWEFWRNPIVIRYRRSRLRPGAAAFWLLATGVLTCFIVLGIYLSSTQREALEPWQAARTCILPIFIIQGIILMLLGTGAVAGGITQEKVEGVLDYQRLTPMTRGAKIVGYFFGLPIREYAMFGVTLPFMLFALIQGNVPVLPILKLYVVFFTSAWLYHMTGFAAGMVSRKWRRAARLSQALVVALYLLLPQLSQFGLVFLEFLTVRPVARWELTEILAPVGEQFAPEGLGNLTPHQAHFFGMQVPLVLFSLVVQALLLLTFGLMVLRKWRADSMHSLGKPYALFLFAAILLLVTGNAWGGLISIISPLALPVAFSVLSLGLAITLLSIVTPTLNAWRQGLRSAAKRGRKGLSLLQDEQMGVPVAVAYAVASGAMSWFYLGEAGAEGVRQLQLPLALAVAILSWQATREWLGGKALGLVSLTLWLVPILVGVLLVASSDALAKPSLYVCALSPLGSMLVSIVWLSGEDASGVGETVRTAAWFGIIVHFCFAVALAIPTARQRAAIRRRELAPAREAAPEEAPVTAGEI